MAWTETVTVGSVSGNTLYASTGDAFVVGTDDDATIAHVGVTLTYTGDVPSHLQVGSQFTLDADC